MMGPVRHWKRFPSEAVQMKTFILGGFQGVGGQTPQQLGLISRVTLPGAGGWSTDLLRSLTA